MYSRVCESLLKRQQAYDDDDDSDSIDDDGVFEQHMLQRYAENDVIMYVIDFECIFEPNKNNEHSKNDKVPIELNRIIRTSRNSKHCNYASRPEYVKMRRRQNDRVIERESVRDKIRFE